MIRSMQTTGSRLRLMRQRPSALPASVIAELAPAVRVAVRAEDVPGDQVEDLVQETLTRLLQARDRLDASTVGGYAVATARNLARSSRRSEAVARRHRHRLLDLSQPLDPLAETLVAEERSAVGRAVAALPLSVRSDLFSEPSGSSAEPSEVARRARLARARAQARVEYVIALRHVELPSPQCKAVLVSISARDRRRQAALQAGKHLLDCAVCGALAEPLIHRRRALAGLVPLPLLIWLARARNVRPAHIGLAASGAAVTAAAVFAAVDVGRPIVAAPILPVQRTEAAAPVVVTTTVGTVYFASGSAALDTADRRALQADAAAIRARHITAVDVTGYTDDTAGDQLNTQLSLQRAEAVAAALRLQVGLNVVITPHGDAAANPTGSNDTAAGRARDRRVVISAA